MKILKIAFLFCILVCTTGKTFAGYEATGPITLMEYKKGLFNDQTIKKGEKYATKEFFTIHNHPIFEGTRLSSEFTSINLSSQRNTITIIEDSRDKVSGKVDMDNLIEVSVGICKSTKN